MCVIHKSTGWDVGWGYIFILIIRFVLKLVVVLVTVVLETVGAGDSGDSGAGDSGDSGAGDSGAGDSGAGDSGDSGAGDSGDSGAGNSCLTIEFVWLTARTPSKADETTSRFNYSSRFSYWINESLRTIDSVLFHRIADNNNEAGNTYKNQAIFF